MKEIAAGHAVAKRRGAIGIQANHEVPPDRSAESLQSPAAALLTFRRLATTLAMRKESLRLAGTNSPQIGFDPPRPEIQFKYPPARVPTRRFYSPMRLIDAAMVLHHLSGDDARSRCAIS